MMRHLLAGVVLATVLSFGLHAQTPQPPAARQPVAPMAPRRPAAAAANVPPEFQLNKVQQAFLDQVLAAWEQSSDRVQTFRCPFVRYVYNAFSPAHHIASSIEEGVVSYQQPDKGSFKINKIHRWTATPVPPGYQGAPKGTYEHDKTGIGDHWVCNGKAVFLYKPIQKQLVESPIPPSMQGKNIVDGPLPFLFGAKAAKLKQRFFMRLHQPVKDGKPVNPNVIHIVAVPKTMRDAVEYQMVEIQLDRKTLLPINMNIVAPDRSRMAYVFYKDKIQVNNALDRIQWTALFATPRTPLGWKKVIDAPPGPQAAGVPQQPPR